MPRHPTYIFKLADGLDRPLAVMGSGQDHAFIMAHKLPCLMRTWIANAYANGHAFVAPNRLWCYTKEKGTHWYAGPTEEFAWLYQFVRHNARLFDGYEAVAPVAVVYDNAARRKNWNATVEPICLALAERNMPFTVVVAGDDWLEGYRLSAAQLAPFKAVVTPKQRAMDAPQCKVLEQVESQGRLVVWPDDARLDALVPRPVTVEGSDGVGVIVRAIPGQAKAPVVVHLLNRRYDAKTDAMAPQKGFTVRLRRDLLPGRMFTKATLHAPRAEDRAIDVTSDEHHTTVKVPELGLWAVIELAE